MTTRAKPQKNFLAVDAGGYGIAVRFVAGPDGCFEHELHAIGGGRAVCCLVSRPQAAVAGPRLQELVVESHAGRPVALGVGMSRSAHWSMSLAPDSPRALIEIDVACRGEGAPGELGTWYECFFETSRSTASDRRVVLTLPPLADWPALPSWLQVPRQTDPATLAASPGALMLSLECHERDTGRCSIALDGRMIGVTPRQKADADRCPAASHLTTWRWRYTVRLERAARP